MATVTALIDWIATAARVGDVADVAARTEGEEEFELRALPNEEIYFYVRPVDNSRVIPQSDPGSTRAAIKYIGSASLAVLVLVGVLLPIAYNVLAGYQIHSLETEREALMRDRAELELREAELLNPARLAILAEYQQLVDPAPETAVPLGALSNGEFALNQR
jgi:hypothetical protein